MTRRRFVRPGDYRIDVSGNTGVAGITAFKDSVSGRFTINAVNGTTAILPQSFTLNGVTLATLTPWITSATKSLEQQTPVAVTNGAFTFNLPAQSVVTFASTFVVANPPVITTQPVSQTVIAGNSVTFSAVANGAPTPTYQWKKDGVAIGGATGSTYTISSATIGDVGNYTVVATNSSGSAISNPAALSIIVAPSGAVIMITVE